ncbi:MAG: hypothetical protein JXA30_20790 [Deltaproteobacteria bacterium]|nr:hypothetical protein [Deltaproteobacteria bacterium]
MTKDDNRNEEEKQADSTRHSYRGRSEESARDFRSPLERLIPELVRRGIEAGRGTLKQTDEALRNVSDSVFAKELVSHFFTQFGDIRQTLSKAVAKEIGRVFEDKDMAAEIRKVLEGMTIEAKLKIEFPDQRKEDEPEKNKVSE